MYVYSEAGPNLFTVGFYPPNNVFERESDHPTREEAAARVNYLNGGISPERLARAIMDAPIGQKEHTPI